MPLEPEIQAEPFIELLKKYKLFKKNELKSLTDPVCSEIKNAEKLQMKPSSIHLFIYENRYESKKLLEKHFNIDPKKGPNKSKVKEDETFSIEKLNNPDKCKNQDFCMRIPAAQLIFNIEKKIKNINWANNLADALCKAKGFHVLLVFSMDISPMKNLFLKETVELAKRNFLDGVIMEEKI